MNLLSAEEQARRMLAYHKTGNDADAAEVLGIRADSFRNWRRSLGLPSRNPKTKPKRKHGTKPGFTLDLESVRDLLPR